MLGWVMWTLVTFRDPATSRLAAQLHRMAALRTAKRLFSPWPFGQEFEPHHTNQKTPHRDVF